MDYRRIYEMKDGSIVFVTFKEEFFPFEATVKRNGVKIFHTYDVDEYETFVSEIERNAID